MVTNSGAQRHRLLNFLATIVVMSSGLITLIGLLSDEGTTAADTARFLIQLVTVIAAVAVLAGLVNLVAVHLGRFVRAERGWPYSILVVVVGLAVGVLRSLDRAEICSGDLEGEQISARVFEAVQVSLESALAALLVFFLVFAAYRLMRDRVTVWNVLFSLTVIVVLVGWIPFDDMDVLRDVRDWVVRVPASAGTRGLLIGVGLGTLVVGVRVLLGQDRSFRD